MNDTERSNLAADSVGDRLRAWRESLLAGLSRTMLVMCLAASTWALPEAWTKGNPAFWLILAGDVLVATVAFGPLRFQWRAYLFVGTLCLYVPVVVTYAGFPGDIGLLIAFVAVAGVLLLGVNRAAIALGISLAGLLFWVVRLKLGWVGRPPLNVTDVGATSVAARVVFDTIWLSIALLLATTYLFRKLARGLAETGQLVTDLRAQMAAREEEARRREEAEQGLLQAQKLEMATERARAVAEEQAAALRREQEAVRSWTEMAVHDLKQPLTGAIALVELLASDPALGRGKTADYLALLASELWRLDQMVGDLVILSRLEQGELKPALAEQPILQVLNRVQELHQVEAASRKVSFEVEADPSLRARIDSLLVLRAVENLVANAFRFVREGDRIRIASSRAGGELVLAVQNSGPQVPAEVRPSLFRGRNTRAGSHKNAGLGLYFCRLVAEAHGGVALLADDSAWNVEFRLCLPG